MKKIAPLSQLFLAAAPPLLAALLLAAPPCRANDAPGIPNQRENRFLFVVDTAARMRGCSNVIVQGVVDLLGSDMRGEFRKGDTIGLWTYNDKLHTEFPMQVWSKEDKSAILDEMAAYLRGRRYEKRAHFTNVMSPLNQVIKTSERITVILISDGSGLIQGTPFDKEINKLQKKYAHELRTAHVPFVTVLTARNGSVFDYTINYPGLVAIPHTANPEMPDEVKPSIAAAIPNPASNAPAKPRPMRSIIMSSATNAVHAAAPAPVAVAAPVAAPPAQPTPPKVVAPVPAPPPVAAVALAPPSQLAVATVTPPARDIAPPQTPPAPPPIVARQNPEPAAAAPPPHAPPTSETPGGQQPPPAPPVAHNAPVASIGPSGGARLALYVMAFSLLTIAVVLVVVLVRRSRRASHPSLISQSIDRPR
jgi:hypothetical protein